MRVVRELVSITILAALYCAALLSGPFWAFLEGRLGALSLLVCGVVAPFAFGALGFVTLSQVLRFPVVILAVVPLIAFGALLTNPWTGAAGRAELGAEGMAIVVVSHVGSVAFGALTARIW